MLNKIASLILGSMVMLAAPSIWAHSLWDPSGIVKPRANVDNGKVTPCGGYERGASPAIFIAGSTIEVTFKSTVYHQGYFRIAFSPADDKGFDSNILADNIADISGQVDRSYTITLPDIECDACTLQLIQSMLDRTPPTNYYSCADIQLVNASGIDRDPPLPVNNLLVLSNDTTVELNWTNPTNKDFAGVLVLENKSSSQQIPQPGQSYEINDTLNTSNTPVSSHAATVVYKGGAENLSLPLRTLGGTYHYALFAYDESLNYSTAQVSTLTLADTTKNVAPVANLRVEQNQEDGANIATDAGVVTLQATITDFNPSDNHTINWSASDSRLNNQSTSASQFIFDPVNLTPGEYIITAQVIDNGSPQLSTSESITLLLTKSTPKSSSGGAFNLLSLCLLFIFAFGLKARSLTLLRSQHADIL